MSYEHQQIDQQIVGVSAVDDAADPITGARLFVGTQPIIVRAIWATVGVVQASASNVLTFKYRPTPGSASGEVTIGTLTVTAGAVGRQFYKDVTPYKAVPGGEIVVQTDGGGTGSVAVGIRYTNSWEMPGNNSAQIASA